MNQPSAQRRRFEPSSVAGLLAVGDLAAIGLFVVAGELSHGYDVLAHAGRVFGTLAPFLVGWILVSIPARLYTRGAIVDVRSAAVRTLVAWAISVGIAQVLRATSIFHGDAALTFALVSFAIGGALLVIWRGAVTLLV